MPLKDFWTNARVVWVSSSHPGGFTRPGWLYVTVESTGHKLRRTYGMEAGKLQVPGPAYLKAQIAEQVARLEAEALAAPVRRQRWKSHLASLKTTRHRARKAKPFLHPVRPPVWELERRAKLARQQAAKLARQQAKLARKR